MIAPYYKTLLGPYFEGKKCVLALSTLAESLPWARLMRELGAESVFVLATGMGAGEQPAGQDVEYLVLSDHGAADLLDSYRRFERMLADLPDYARRRLDEFDPGKKAVVLTNTLFSLSDLDGRRVFFSRPAAWSAIEDKTRVDAIWRQWGVSHARSLIVAPRESALREATMLLASENGTVWSGDCKEGVNGGSYFVRWVRTNDQFRSALHFFSNHCDTVRVAQFLDGIPCSIHGIVFPDRVIVGRPVEQLVFADPELGTFRYAGVATAWDPPNAERDRMRDLAGRVGALLRESVRYRGSFSIDGILTRDGFSPTEINARYSAGISLLAAGMPDVPLGLLDMFLRAGIELDYRSAEVEERLTTSAEMSRRVMGVTVSRRPFNASHTLHWGDATVSLGPADVGSMARISFSDPFRKDEPAAPAVAAILRRLEAEYGMGFGRVIAPSELFRLPSAFRTLVAHG